MKKKKKAKKKNFPPGRGPGFSLIFMKKKFPQNREDPPELAGCWEVLGGVGRCWRALGGVGGRWEVRHFFFPPACAFFSLVKFLNTCIVISGIRPRCGGVNLPKWTSSEYIHDQFSHTAQYTQYTQYTQYSTVLVFGQFPHSTQYTVHSTQYTVHSTQYTVHSTQYTVHSTQYTVHSTQYTVAVQYQRSGFSLGGHLN